MITRAEIERIWIDDNNLYIRLVNGQTAVCAFAEWPHLANAKPEQREAFTLSRFGIHWPEIDEDLSFDGLFRNMQSQIA